MTKCQEQKQHTDPVFLSLVKRKHAAICLGCETQISGDKLSAEDLKIYIEFAKHSRTLFEKKQLEKTKTTKGQHE